MNDVRKLEAAKTFTSSQLRIGKSPLSVEEALVQRGFSKHEARGVIEDVIHAAREVRQVVSNVGQYNMAIGALLCVVGTLVTLFTYQAASNSPGGKFIVAWGAIVIGFAQFIGGLYQTHRSR
jgi:hypothetical protein